MADNKSLNTSQKLEVESTSINVSFFIYSTMLCVVLSVFMIGAQDILEGTTIPTSTVLLADIGPCSVAPLILPFFINRIPYIVRVVLFVVGHFSAFMILGLAENVSIKIFAVSLATFSTGIGDISLLSLTTYFRPTVLSWYSTGSGVGLILAPLYYTAMTTWLNISPGITFLTLGPCSLIYLVCYYFIHKEMTKKERESVEITAVENQQNASGNKKEDFSEDQKEKKVPINKDPLSCNEKLSAVMKMTRLVCGASIVSFFAEYTFFDSVITTIAYPRSPFPPRDHYQYYSLALMVGEVLGRSNRSILEIVKPNWLFSPSPLLLWVLAFLDVLHLIFFFFESWYRFLPGVGIPVLLCFTGGFFAGIVFTSVMELVRESFDAKEREFILAVALLPTNLGILSASIAGIYIEPQLKEHCLSTLTVKAYCFTRHSNL